VNSITPTAYSEINSLIQKLLSKVKIALGEYFLGMYIHGSLASGDFNPESSDIDFLVVTSETLPEEIRKGLKIIHKDITNSGLPWAKRLEGSYIPEKALRRYDPTQIYFPSLGVDGSFALDGHGSDWIIQRYIIREYGIVLCGPQPKTLIDPIQPNDLRQSVLGILDEWWSFPLPSPERFQSSEYQAYAVLTMCRAIYTLEHGTVVSKPFGGHWAKNALENKWGTLIQWALSWKHGIETDRMNETLDFIRYIGNYCKGLNIDRNFGV